MVAVFAAFATAEVVLVKAMGLGMAIAVALDATLVRILVVPAAMRLLGEWNGWAGGTEEMTNERRSDLKSDVRWAAILGRYLDLWGMPDERTRFTKASETVDVYLFSGQEKAPVRRLATVGMSSLPAAGEGTLGVEFLMVLPPDLAGCTFHEVAGYMMDLVAYSMRPDVGMRPETTARETPLAPSHWPTRAMLFDEPRGESERLEDICVGTEHVRLLWLVPIHPEEQRLITERGLEEFDALCERADASLANPMRSSVVSGRQ
jgi:hypothetical protein